MQPCSIGTRVPALFDTYTQAPGVFPTRINLFDQKDTSKGIHLTNNKEANKLPQGHSLTIKGISLTSVGTSQADLDKFMKQHTLFINLNGKVQHEGKPFFYPQSGGSTADAAVTNGSASWASVNVFEREHWIYFPAGETFEVYFLQGGAAVSSVGDVYLTLALLGDWQRP